jgi:hypothetical protein
MNYCNMCILLVLLKNLYVCKIHTYHSRLIPEGVAETSQILLRDTRVLPK